MDKKEIQAAKLKMVQDAIEQVRRMRSSLRGKEQMLHLLVIQQIPTFNQPVRL